MKKSCLILLLLVGATPLLAQNDYGTVVGEVVDPSSDPVSYARVYVISPGGESYYGLTDFDGHFRVNCVPPGEYNVTICNYGDTLKDLKICVFSERICFMGTIEFDISSILIGCDFGLWPDVRYLEDELPDRSLTSSEIEFRPDKFDVPSMISTKSARTQLNALNQISIRGARPDDVLYLIDGVKMRGVRTIPSSSIGEITVYTGGVPAKYGDTTGGVVVIETLGIRGM